MKKMSAKAGFGVLAALMHEEARPILLDEASALDADEEVLETLLSRLRKAVAFDYELGYSYSLLLSWLTARVGPRLKTACELVEAVVDNAAAASTNIVMPRWALSVSIDSALQRRMPCVPFIDADDGAIADAYRGLVEHLEFIATLPDEQQRLELLNSAIPWRIVALVDRLEPESIRSDGKPTSIKTRIGTLRSRTLRPDSPGIEHAWWKHLNEDLCSRRHALSHLGEDDGWSFSHCLKNMWTLQEARSACAAIALAVLNQVATDLRARPADPGILDAVLRDAETEWLDHQDEAAPP